MKNTYDRFSIGVLMSSGLISFMVFSMNLFGFWKPQKIDDYMGMLIGFILFITSLIFLRSNSKQDA